MDRPAHGTDTPAVWDAAGLESPSACPVCGADARAPLHEGLTDRIFGAPGTWTLHGCESCGTAYLDPRPTPDTIGIAYRRYYTHGAEDEGVPMNWRGRLRRRLANGYRNHRYGTRDHPASPLGRLAAALLPNGRAILDAGMRHLPAAGPGQRLLDLGCGNSGFLLRARSAGWDVVGVDFDEEAVRAARRRGFDVRLGGVETLDPARERFDVVTMSHVIEHVHDPVGVLRACFNLLTTGGFLWLETPNIAAEGHRLFGADWRGLEPPRHLVVFSVPSLRRALVEAGFGEVRIQPYRPMCDETFRASKALADGIDPYAPSVRTGPSEVREMVREAERAARQDPEKREFITMKAWKA